MKILQYTLGLPPYRRGGLPRYSTDLSTELARDNEVVLLYPGRIPFKSSLELKFVLQESSYPFQVVEMLNPLPVSLGLGIKNSAPYMIKRKKENICTFLKTLNPDIIHIHTLMGLPIEFLEVAKELNIKTIYTTHDFYGLCPKMLTSNPKKLLKSRSCSFDCMLCKDGPSIKKIQVMQSKMYMYLKNTLLMKKIRQKQKGKIVDSPDTQNEELLSLREVTDRYELRMYYMRMFKLIEEFHFNSSVSEKYLKKYLPNVKGKVISITHKGIKRSKTNLINFNKNIVNIGYIGPYDKKKGFFELIQVLNKVRGKNPNFEFHAYGDILKNDIFNKSWAKNHGIIASNQMNKVYRNIDILVMPSLWHETFGFTVLEALANNDVCLVSKNVGAKDLVRSECVFENQADLKKKIICFLNNPIDRINYEKEKIISRQLPIDFSDHVNDIYQKLYLK